MSKLKGVATPVEVAYWFEKHYGMCPMNLMEIATAVDEELCRRIDENPGKFIAADTVIPYSVTDEFIKVLNDYLFEGLPIATRPEFIVYLWQFPADNRDPENPGIEEPNVGMTRGYCICQYDSDPSMRGCVLHQYHLVLGRPGEDNLIEHIGTVRLHD